MSRPPVPEGWEFRLSHDRRYFAFYDPGNGPWFVPEPSMRGRFVDSAEMNSLDWYRYIPEQEQPPVAAPSAPADSVTLTRGQLAALLAHHADVLAARWHAVAPGAGAWEVAAAYSLRGHAAELTADEETPAVRELLVSVLTFNAEQQPAAVPPVLADAERRDRYATAIRQAGDTAYGNRPFYEAITDAVIAVADAEQAGLRARITELKQRADRSEKIRENADFHLGQEMARRQRAEKETTRLRAERAAVLREAADVIEGIDFHPNAIVRSLDVAAGLAHRLRRMADEAQPACTCGPDEACGDPCNYEAQQAGDSR
ncbi:hypothetical protein [Streptomyces spectabilis]|uniref:WW domain-containing protein n=1 Tax=Streptomyces spectabilis TaxID=68270 RepID=A0A5P2X870_STRST|nr:hypothetical protein [Streptomyces spectabilis]MBB5108364.1 hypothetical protein [Streptomyces spectabilis]MCI3901121.1 hypothetical protein [Streptomyces spectabilis]QEV58612.1 hypothetical protein CP982_07675 [Streptomyces spectabilis]GGV46090.1 hypothetical protein GCM10010245_72260 [Streptomyces spectabilis]